MRAIAIAAIVLGLSTAAFAQGEQLGSGAPAPDYRSGWTFTPTMGIGETYDDNISLFGVGTAEGLNNDYVMSFFPSADLHYEGKHTQFGVGYGGSFLGYHTYDTLDRWDQHGTIELRRQESARLKWFARGSAVTRPETDLIDLGGIPYRHTGATELDGHGGGTFEIDARDSLTFTSGYQDVQFERTDLAPGTFLRGGNIFDNLAAFRRRVSSRLSLGADYSFRRAMVVDDPEHFNMHGVEGAADYDLNDLWSISGAAGVMYMQATALEPARTGPALRIGVSHHRDTTSFHVSYIESYIPAFGYGGIVRNEELGAGFRSQLFHSRRFYTENSLIYRYDTPVVQTDLLLPLKSLLAYSIVGWEPDRWVRFEVFYARVDQSSLRPGGMLYRNRIGFQIVTSKPMRIQ